MIISMCGGTSDEGNEKNIISLSTTHTEIIQMLEAENQLIGVDSFSETELPIKKIEMTISWFQKCLDQMFQETLKKRH